MVNLLFFNRTRQAGTLKPGCALKPVFCAQLLSFITALLLTGCALSDTADGPNTQRPLLQPLMEISSAQTGTAMGMRGSGQIVLRRPAAMSARGNDVYLIDAGLHRIFRYDRNQQTLMPFATNLSAEAGMSLYVAPDRTVYVTDPARGQVLHFTWDGMQLPSLVSPGNLARPVSVAVDQHGQVLVADALYDKIVVFSSLGMTLSVIKPQQVLAIASMTAGPDGLYIIDHLARQVVALGWDGSFRDAFGADDMGEPGIIAVSRDNLVFVSDNFNHTVQVYRDGLLVTKIGGMGIVPGSFNGITGLAVDEDMLYVADSLNARVQIMLINPEQRTKIKGQKTTP